MSTTLKPSERAAEKIVEALISSGMVSRADEFPGITEIIARETGCDIASSAVHGLDCAIVRVLQNDFDSFWKCKQRGETIEISTPYLLPSSALFSVFLTKRGDRYIVCDGGGLIEALAEHSDLPPNEIKEAFSGTASKFGVKIGDLEGCPLFFKDCTDPKMISALVFELANFAVAASSALVFALAARAGAGAGSGCNSAAATEAIAAMQLAHRFMWQDPRQHQPQHAEAWRVATGRLMLAATGLGQVLRPVAEAAPAAGAEAAAYTGPMLPTDRDVLERLLRRFESLELNLSRDVFTSEFYHQNAQALIKDSIGLVTATLAEGGES